MSRLLAYLALILVVPCVLAYRASYVEYHATSACGSGTCGAATKSQNVAALAGYAQAAAAQGAQLLVTPEYGITGFSSYPARSWYQGGYTETFGEPAGVPCDQKSTWTYAPSIVGLSCAAKENSIAIVANIAEWADGSMYNTDIAFDTDGTFLVKYRKTNLWGETYMSVPQDCKMANFTTSFGVNFGLFTCADLIYKYPAVALVEQGITDFLMPAAWSDEMAQMQVMSFAQGWSTKHKSTLILCNHRTTAESGSGVWVAGKPLSTSFYPDTSDGALKVVDVTAGLTEPPPAHGVLATASTVAQETPLRGGNWQFTPLTEGAKVCSASVCCTASGLQGAGEGYILGVLDGTDTDDGESWRAQICGVFPCQRASSQCLNYRKASSGQLQGVSLQAAGMAQGVETFPEVVATSQSEEQIMLTPGASTNAFNYTSSADGGQQVSVSTTHTVTSVMLYGRLFAQDILPYKCN